jgi:PD-(D/E)XK nuclease superfamily
MPYKFSPSSLSLLKECPRCFWLRFRKGIKRPAGIFPSLPNGMDRILKAHFDSFMRRGELPPELHELERELDGAVKLFDDVALLSIWRDNYRGIRWTDKDGTLYRGAVDNILMNGDKLIVIDYKTRGYPLKENTPGYYQNQMDIYNFLLRKNDWKTEDYAYLIFYHPLKVREQGDVVFNVDLVRMEISIENAMRIFTTALDLLEGEMPEPAKDCEYCKWVDNCNSEIKPKPTVEMKRDREGEVEGESGREIKASRGLRTRQIKLNNEQDGVWF